MKELKSLRPTKDEALRAFKRMDGIFSMASIHGDNTPDKDVTKLFKWIEFELNIERDTKGERV